MKLKHLLLFSASALVLSISFAQARGNQGQLTKQQQKVIDYLVKDWGEDYSVTTVDIAMKAVIGRDSVSHRQLYQSASRAA